MNRKFYEHRKTVKTTGTRRRLEDMKHNELEKKLDAEVSFYVRMAFSDDGGYAQCYTCGAYHSVKDLDCGHYISRTNRGTRWDLRNLRPQCTECNCFNEGRHEVFRKNLVRDLGEDAVEDLEKTAEFYGSTRMPREWLIAEINRYRGLNAKTRNKMRSRL